MKNMMVDMGMTNSERYGAAVVSSKEEKDKKYYDSIMMPSDKMPKDMPEMHAGEMHRMMVDMMIKSVETSDDGTKKYKLELRHMGKAPKEEKEINPYRKNDE